MKKKKTNKDLEYERDELKKVVQLYRVKSNTNEKNENVWQKS